MPRPIAAAAPPNSANGKAEEVSSPVFGTLFFTCFFAGLFVVGYWVSAGVAGVSGFLVHLP